MCFNHLENISLYAPFQEYVFGYKNFAFEPNADHKYANNNVEIVASADLSSFRVNDFLFFFMVR